MRRLNTHFVSVRNMWAFGIYGEFCTPNYVSLCFRIASYPRGKRLLRKSNHSVFTLTDNDTEPIRSTVKEFFFAVCEFCYVSFLYVLRYR